MLLFGFDNAKKSEAVWQGVGRSLDLNLSGYSVAGF